jgi:adenosine deaminase
MHTTHICTQTPTPTHTKAYTHPPSVDIPMVISTDDAGLMTYNLLSYDFYEAYMAFGLDIAGLKKLIFNSIHYSGLFSFEKEALRVHVQSKWEEWVQLVLDMTVISVLGE